MDPLTALSVAGTVVQFVDFSCKLMSASRQLYTKSELDVHGQAASAANDILDYTIKLQRSLRQPGGSVSVTLTEDDRLLESICKGCDDLAHDLLARLEKLKVPQRDKKRKLIIWPTLTAAFQSIWTAEDLLALQDRLQEYRRQIDSRVIRSLSTKIDAQFLKQSERFDRLDAANKELVTSLVNHSASDERGLQAQVSALSTLLDRAEVVIATQEDANKKIIVDVLERFIDVSSIEKSNPLLAEVRTADQDIRKAIPTEILESLRFPAIGERFEAVDESHVTTFDWIFRPVQDTAQYAEGRRWGDFSAWLEFGTGIYWINGKAGSGKSTLMKYIVGHSKTSSLLGHWAGDMELCTSAFFFWNSGSKQQCSQAGLLRSLLYEILGQHPELIPTVLPAQWGAKYSAKYQGRRSPPESWQLSTLKTAFKTLIAQRTVPMKLCLFIDGLDEYEGGDEEIADLFGKASMSHNVKICCSSRPHQVFEDAFANRPGLRLQDLTIPDMRKYVHDRLEKNTRMQRLNEEEPDATKELIEEIGNAASGVFLWVRLVVTSLLSGLGKRDGISYLQMRLRELPPELDDLYEHMVFKVDKVYQKETAQLFQLVGTAFRDQADKFSPFRDTEQLSVLLLSFALEKNTTLALEAKSGFISKEEIINRCKTMEIHLRTRCGGLLEINYQNQDPYTTTISPDMKVAYLHRTVKDYLELWETRERLADRSGSQQKNVFSASQAIFKANLLTLKALDPTSIIERPSWGLLEDAITWARRAERDTQTSQPELLDELYSTASDLWKPTPLNQLAFFLQQKSMLTLACQCGLSHYLDAKLSTENAISTWQHSRSLLDYALVPAPETETFVSVGVVNTLLKHGARPNKCEPGLGTSPWQNALSYLNVTVYGMSDGPKKVYILSRWIPIIKMLLEAGADPDMGCPKPVRYINIKHRRVLDDKLWPPEEVFARTFGQREPDLRNMLECARLEKRRAKALKSQEKSGACCIVL